MKTPLKLKTYIYDKDEKYNVVLTPFISGTFTLDLIAFYNDYQGLPKKLNLPGI